MLLTADAYSLNVLPVHLAQCFIYCREATLNAESKNINKPCVVDFFGICGMTCFFHQNKTTKTAEELFQSVADLFSLDKRS